MKIADTVLTVIKPYKNDLSRATHLPTRYRVRKNQPRATDIVRLADMYQLPEDILEIILRYVYSWGPPKVNNQGYVVASMKNIRKCPTDLVLDDVVNRGRWTHIARLPALHSYERRVCIWKPEYYDMGRNISGLSDWAKPILTSLSPYDIALPLRRIDRRSEEWIGFKSWIQTHPAFAQNDFRSSAWGASTSSKMLSKHWFKYELELAYPTLYGKNGWAKKLK